MRVQISPLWTISSTVLPLKGREQILEPADHTVGSQPVCGVLTIRVHLDTGPETNTLLLVAPGSHKRGRIPSAEIPEVVRQCGILTCLVAPGDI